MEDIVREKKSSMKAGYGWSDWTLIENEGYALVKV